MLGLLGLVGLALSIAGGVLGSPTSLSPSTVALPLREAAAGIFAAFFVIYFFLTMGSWTYRWHLRSYRRNVSLIFNLISRLIYDIFPFGSSWGGFLRPFCSLARELPILFLQHGPLQIFLVNIHQIILDRKSVV